MSMKKDLSRITIDMPLDLQKKLKALAALNDMSMRTVVIKSIEKEVKILESKTDIINKFQK